MQEGYEQRTPAMKAEGAQADDDPVVAFLFSQSAPPERPAPASRSISRLENRRGTLYLPTHGTAARGQRMLQQW